MKINPVLRNESKLAVRTWKFPLMILVYTGLLAAGGILLYKGLTSDAIFEGLDLATPIRIYLILAIGQAVLLMFIVPSMSSTAISSEREKQTLEVLLSSKMSSLSIIVGKLVSSVSKVIMLIFLTLPVYAITFLIGGVNIENLFQLSLFLIVTTFFIGSVGIFFSTVFKSSKGATAATYGAVLFILIGIMIIGAIVYSVSIKNAQEGVTVLFPNFVVASPLTGFLSLLVNQLGIASLLDGPLFLLYPIMTMDSFGSMIYVSIGLQAVATIGLVLVSSYILNPIKSNKFRKKTI